MVREDSSHTDSSLRAEVGCAAPAFDLECVDLRDGSRRRVRPADYAGRWLLLLFCPDDAMFGCGAELASFSAMREEFERRHGRVLIVGLGPVDAYEQHFDQEREQPAAPPMQLPLASDPSGVAARAFGVWNPEARSPRRGLFVIDPAGVVQYQVVHDLCVGRSTEDALRVLDALRAGGLCALRRAEATDAEHPALAIGPERMLGHYRVGHQLGQGGFGQVYQAWDSRLHRHAALKLLRPGTTAGRERIVAEARSAARLSHPNICTIYAIEEHNGQPLIAMEYVAGQSLAQRLRAEGALSPYEARVIALQVASAIGAAHAQGVVHGDLKPGNIMLTHRHSVKVLDFGLASCDAAPASVEIASATSDGTIRFRGTPSYMNPEQARGRPLVPASDVFTFGLVLYEMLVGKRVIAERSPVTAARLVRKADLAERVWAALPSPFREIAAACLSQLPADRPTMDEIARRFGNPSFRSAPPGLSATTSE